MTSNVKTAGHFCTYTYTLTPPPVTLPLMEEVYYDFDSYNDMAYRKSSEGHEVLHAHYLSLSSTFFKRKMI